MKRYFIKFAMSLALVSSLFLTSCETDNSVTYSDEDVVVGTIHGVVTDANNNARMEGVVVNVVQKGAMFTTETDELGYYVVKSLYSGDYEATFVIDGYAVSRAYGYIPTVEEVTNSKITLNQSEVLDMDLYSLNAGLTGKLYKVIEDGNVVAAAGVTVIADYDHFDLSPNEYTAVTNASGVFTFTNIPAAPMVGVRTNVYTDGTYTFDPTYQMVDLVSGGSVTAPEMPLFITDAEPFVVTHNLLDGFIISDNIVMTFNKAIDTTTFEIDLGIDKSSKTEINSVVWSNGNMTVTINPDENLRLDTWYYMNFYAKSVDGNETGDNYYFKTQPGIEVTTTNLQVYDEYNQITINQAMIINFSIAVDTSDPNNYISFSGLASGTPTAFSWSNGDKTLTISAPVGSYTSGDQFWLYIGVTSTLANYDYYEDSWSIHVE